VAQQVVKNRVSQPEAALQPVVDRVCILPLQVARVVPVEAAEVA